MEMTINRYLDHAVLAPELSRNDAVAAIRTGIAYAVRTVCVRPCDIALARELCAGTQTAVCCVLDFPHGTGGAEAKESLAKAFISQGAAEIDMVMNYGFALSGLWDKVEDEIARVVGQAHDRGVLVKVIFETSEWPLDIVGRGVEACVSAGADFVKTSTGFSKSGATEEVVREMLRVAGNRILVKPSGGIRDYAAAMKYVGMGCARLGVGFKSTPLICSGPSGGAGTKGADGQAEGGQPSLRY